MSMVIRPIEQVLEPPSYREAQEFQFLKHIRSELESLPLRECCGEIEWKRNSGAPASKGHGYTKGRGGP